MAHYYEVNDSRGDLIDLIVFCSDWCHRNHCEQNGLEYGGWNGCHELEFTDKCAYCESKVYGIN
jgi:hypothetical protein